jgi:DNA-binding NtrC family response regulator
MSRPAILIVDDDANLLQGLELTLRKEYRLLAASDAGTALRILGSQTIDVVLADHRMPGMNGLEFLRIVRNRHPDTVRIVMTGHVTAELAIQALNEAEVYRFLRKPVSPDDMHITLYLACERQKLDRENRRLYAIIHGDPDMSHQPAASMVEPTADYPMDGGMGLGRR